MEVLERVLSIVKARGPLLPADIAREISTNLIMAGAMLSELAGKGSIKISTVKVGGSPLYYAPGQEYKLQQYASRLGSKEKEAYELLKAKGVLRDRAQEPVIRVALRAIKDFAKPLDVTISGETETFWKWYMLTSEQAGEIIKQALAPRPEPKPELPPEPKKEEKPAEAKAPEPKKAEPEKKEEPKAEKKEEKPIEAKRQEPEKKEEKKEEKKPEAPAKEEIKEKRAEKKRGEKKEEPAEEKKGALFEDKTTDDPFVARIMAHFRKNSIDVIERKVIKKNSEADFIIRIPSPVGSLKYYCKAKSKAKPGDSDISTAYVQGHMKKLPVLFIYTGELTKKAKEMLGKEFDNVTVKKI